MKKIIPLILTTIVFICLFPTMENHTQNLRFVDEEEHFVIGDLLNKNYRLYKDISTNHQPFNYFISQLTIKVTNPPNIFMLIKRHREIVYLWSYLWALILVTRFGIKVLPAIAIFETTKYFTLGNQLLAESLAAYPLGYYFVSVFEQVVYKKTRREDIFLGIITAISSLTLVPLIVPLFILNIIRLIYNRFQHWYLLIISTLISALIIIYLVSNPLDYFRETIFNNFVYGLAGLSQVKTPSQFITLIFLPFQVITNPLNDFSNWIRYILITLIISAAILIYKRKYSYLLYLIVSYFIWASTNARVYLLDVYYYSAFHLNPWLFIGLLQAFIFLPLTLKQLKNHLRLFTIGILIIGAVFLLTRKTMPLYAHIDTQTDHYIQYNHIAQITQIIDVVKNSDQRLMVLPHESILHWTTQLKPTTRQVTYYQWQYLPPRNRLEYFTALNNPPEYIVFYNDNSSYTPSMRLLLSQQYTQLFTVYQNSYVTSLYIHNSVYQKLSQQQWQELKSLPLTLENLPKIDYD